jgi:hypothetical protein
MQIFSLKLSWQTEKLYKTGNIIVPYILISIFLDSKLDDKMLWIKWQQAFLEFNLLLNRSITVDFQSVLAMLELMSEATTAQ